uniref:Hematopoietic SH2 domain containing n=1 Tax=Catagonus wagneri TaxID=51154 RepID=A0A8C3W9K3_9CETA
MTEARRLPPPLPPRLDWFIQTQVDQLAQGGVPAWFHGAISREDAENLLESQPLGSFLIRVSHSHVGYTLSYKAPNCCRHFMVKLLDDGSFVIPGEDRVYASLDALVTFHQQQPVRPHEDLLTQPCQQKDPENTDYEELFLYSNALAEEATCPTATPEEASAKPVPLYRPKEKKPSAELVGASTEEATPSCSPKAPHGETRQKLWRNLKMLPQTGKKVQQQLKSRLGAVSSESRSDTRPSVATHGPGAGAGDPAWGDNTSTDHSEATSLAGPSQPRPPRDRGDAPRKALRSTSWSEATTRVRGWHQELMRALSSQASKPEPAGLKEPQNDRLPEEYRPPPPFAPGYC